MTKLPMTMLIPYDLALKLQVAINAKDYDNQVFADYVRLVALKKDRLVDRINYDHAKPDGSAIIV